MTYMLLDSLSSYNYKKNQQLTTTKITQENKSKFCVLNRGFGASFTTRSNARTRGFGAFRCFV